MRGHLRDVLVVSDTPGSKAFARFLSCNIYRGVGGLDRDHALNSRAPRSRNIAGTPLSSAWLVRGECQTTRVSPTRGPLLAPRSCAHNHSLCHLGPTSLSQSSTLSMACRRRSAVSTVNSRWRAQPHPVGPTIRQAQRKRSTSLNNWPIVTH